IGYATLPILIVFGWLVDRKRKRVPVMYNLFGEYYGAFKELVDSIENLTSAKRIWHIHTQIPTSDWKSHAGAHQLSTRTRIKPLIKSPKTVKTNVSIPCLPAGRQKLYFFPDMVCVFDGGRVGAIDYDDLRFRASISQWIETERVPRDAKVIGQTWAHPNKKGGPDRRFANNRQIPVCAYGEGHFESSSGLNELFMVSNPEALWRLAASFDRLSTAIADSRPEPSERSDNLSEQVPNLASPGRNRRRMISPDYEPNPLKRLG
ncbi:MAG TPA: hypothetical protein VJS64_04270, partial [Pyrinomonadaceae bacterium]|nr:hypothetical protein [Pyrinomonadaceae bacterium]